MDRPPPNRRFMSLLVTESSRDLKLLDLVERLDFNDYYNVARRY